MTWMENENVARANHGFAGKQGVGRGTLNGVGQREDRRIIIRKDLGVLILPVLLIARTSVARAKVTVWVMCLSREIV